MFHAMESAKFSYWIICVNIVTINLLPPSPLHPPPPTSPVAHKAVSYKLETLFKLPQQEKLSLKEVAQNAVRM